MNLSNTPLVNPLIRYFAENPRIQYCKANPNDSKCEGMQFNVFDVDSTLKAVVDYQTLVHSVDTSFYYDSRYTVISLKFNGSIPAQATSVVRFRIMKKNYPAWDCSHDYSYQANAATQENFKMAVYDGDGNILWGNDPVALKHDTTNVYWHDRAGMTVVSRYDGTDSAKVFDGRFWLLKESPLTPKERMSLDSVGAKLLETTRYQNKGLHLLKALVPIRKKSLDKALSNFYNAFVVDDSTKLSLKIIPEDLYEETRTCDKNYSCTTVVNERVFFDMSIECWPDISMDWCKNIVLACGPDSAFIDRDLILAKINRDSVQCLENNSAVRNVLVQQKFRLNNNISRITLNVDLLQNDLKWQRAVGMPQITTEWLSDADYAGNGITVGVYDSGIDFRHPDFNEVGEHGEIFPRKADGFSDGRTVANGLIDLSKCLPENCGSHGTWVAGVIGGNGRMSQTHKLYKEWFDGCGDLYVFRGVAPKVKFHSGKLGFNYQKGVVVNHSHELSENVFDEDDVEISKYHFYGYQTSKVDEYIFRDWKMPSEKGDNLTKTVVVAAGNNAGHMGYHSLGVNLKNSITVGAVCDDGVNYDLAYFSSLGPTWDGRIKPDIMAPGCQIRTSSPYEYLEKNDYYSEVDGTSLSAPFVTGIVALMYEKFQKLTELSLDKYSMRNSTSKALLIHSAKDMQGCENENKEIAINSNDELKCTPYTLGPDFATGWGLANAKSALDLMDGYDVKSRKFDKFREFDIYNGIQKRWTVNVDESRSRLRVTLVWDDAPGNISIDNYMKPKLVNDLDLYLISPSGKIYYPWRLSPLPVTNINEDGSLVSMVFYGAKIKGLVDNRLKSRKSGLEKITFVDAATSAYKCESNDFVVDECFDRLNNVEVVDVDNPELGTWQVVVKGYRVEVGNSLDGMAQIASIVSDLRLNEPMNGGLTPYAPNKQTSELIDLGGYCKHIEGCLEYYVTFSSETSLGQGDHIYLFDEWDHLIGDYMGNSLANQRILVKTRFLKIILDSDNDQSQGYGYSISKIESVPYGILQVLFPPYKKGD